MKIRTLFFGIAKDIVGHSSKIIELKKKTTIGQFQVYLTEEYNDLKGVNNFAFAVNEEYATSDHQINENDTVAVIPPVSGG